MKKKILLVLMFALVLTVAGCSSNRGNRQPEPEYALLTADNLSTPIENEETEYEAMPIYETNAEDENEEEHTPSPPTPIVLTDPRVRWVVEPQWEFVMVGSFIEGASWAVAYDYVNDILTTVYGYLNSRGEIIIPFENNPIGDMATSAASLPQDFSEGLVVVQPANSMHMELRSVGLHGVFNIDGELVFPLPEHSWTTSFSGGLAAVWGHGYVDIFGNLIEERPPHHDIANYFSDGLQAVMMDYRTGYINKSGELAIPFNFDVTFDEYWGTPILRNFREGFASVVETEWGESDSGRFPIAYRWGFINTQGEIVVPLIYDLVRDFSEGRAVVWYNDFRDVGVIDEEGGLIVSFGIYDSILPFSEGLAAVSYDNSWGFIDRYGNVIIPFEYTYVRPFTNGLATVQLGHWPDDKWGFIDREGNVVVPIEFDDVRSFSEGLAWVRQGNLWGIIEIVDETVAVFDSNINFTTYWAKTDEFVFLPDGAGIVRLPLSDITQGDVIPVPSDGEARLVGINEDYIFVCRRDVVDWQYYRIDTYRVSLQTLETTLIDSGNYSGVPFYHAASNSILFPHQKWHSDLGTLLFWLEALQLETGERHIIYESNSFIDMGIRWRKMKNGTALGNYGSRVFIDAELHARSILWDDIDWSGYAEQANWLDNLPLAVLGDPEQPYWGHAVRLSSDGSIEKTLGSGFDGHNWALNIERLTNTNFVMIIEHEFPGFGRVISLYCTETGALFSSQN